MAAYVIYECDILDQQRYDEYKPKGAASVAAANGRYLVRGGTVRTLEGDTPASRTVVIEFPSMQAALDWYQSEDYANARDIRKGAASTKLYIVDGI